jgi:hypothetical protein
MQDWISILSFALQMLNFIEQSPFWELIVTQLLNKLSISDRTHKFITCSQKSDIGPYTEPNKSSTPSYLFL